MNFSFVIVFFHRYRIIILYQHSGTFPIPPPHLHLHTYIHFRTFIHIWVWSTGEDGRMKRKNIAPKETNISDLLTSFSFSFCLCLCRCRILSSFSLDVAKHQQQQCFNIQITKMCTFWRGRTRALLYIRVCVYVCALTGECKREDSLDFSLFASGTYSSFHSPFLYLHQQTNQT